MIAAFATGDVEAVVTWNPLVSSILEDPAATRPFDRSGIPGEIIDLMVVNTETLADNPAFGKALTGAWYELMGMMAAGDQEALTAAAEAAGTDLAGDSAQLAATQMFYDSADAVAFAQGADLPETMVNVAEVRFDKGILGEGAPSAAFVGVADPQRLADRGREQRPVPVRHNLHAYGRRRQPLTPIPGPGLQGPRLRLRAGNPCASSTEIQAGS